MRITANIAKLQWVVTAVALVLAAVAAQSPLL